MLCEIRKSFGAIFDVASFLFLDHNYQKQLFFKKPKEVQSYSSSQKKFTEKKIIIIKSIHSVLYSESKMKRIASEIDKCI